MSKTRARRLVLGGWPYNAGVGSSPSSAGAPAEAASETASADRRLEALAKEYAGLIVAVAARVGGALTEAYRDDIRQNVLIALWKRLERPDPIERPSSYIFKAAVRETARTVRRELERRQRGEPLDTVAEPVSEHHSPQRLLAGQEHAVAIRECLAELDVDRRRAVKAHLAGFDVDEIMRNYGWPYQKARNLVARGMSDLRLALARRGIHGR